MASRIFKRKAYEKMLQWKQESQGQEGTEKVPQ